MSVYPDIIELNCICCDADMISFSDDLQPVCLSCFRRNLEEGRLVFLGIDKVDWRKNGF